MVRNKQRIAVGVDLGGTKIAVAVVSHTGKIIGHPVTVSTEASRPVTEIVNSILILTEQVTQTAGLSWNDISGIGIGCPGPLDIQRGIVLTPPNLPTLHNFPLKKVLQTRLKKPVYLNNDGNVFVLGESWFGAGKRASIVYGITLGTGFGSGFVINKRIFNGSTGTAAEIWCFPYKDSIAENYVSSKGIKTLYRTKTGREIAPHQIADLARTGNKPAQLVYYQFGIDLGTNLAYVVDVIDPDLIVVGGSISKSFDLFVRPAEETLRRLINPAPRAKIKLVPAKLGDSAGIIGAACLVFSKINLREEYKVYDFKLQ